MEWFKSQKLTEHITRITDITGVFMYLVQGSQKALLIDTGCGIGNLKEYLSTLTKLPLTVVCTHGHMDHAGGAWQFEKVYMNPEDVELSISHCTVENRKQYTEIAVMRGDIDGEANQIETWDYYPVRTADYEPLKDKMEFELGGITVRALAFNGHTQGCMSMLFCEERTILYGDACNPSVFLFDTETMTVEEYREELVKFRQHQELYDIVWLSHGDGQPYDESILEACIEVCDEILEEQDEKVDFQFMGGLYKAAHSTLPSQLRADGGLANIIYNPQHIR